MSTEKGSWNPPGRSGSWRTGMLVGGLLCSAVGVLILCWPQIIVWFVAGVFFLLGAFLIASALLARGGGEPAPDGVFVEPED